MQPQPPYPQDQTLASLEQIEQAFMRCMGGYQEAVQQIGQTMAGVRGGSPPKTLPEIFVSLQHLTQEQMAELQRMLFPPLG